MTDRWQLEVAAMLSCLGLITVAPATCDKLEVGHMLSDAERRQLERVPAVTEQLLAHIPRLEGVRAIATHAHPPRRDPDAQTIGLAAHVLHLAAELHALERTESALDPLDVLRGRDDCDRALVDALDAARKLSKPQLVVKNVSIAGLRVGMTFAEDVKLASGVLLVARGYAITFAFLERLHNYAHGAIREPLRILESEDLGSRRQ